MQYPEDWYKDFDMEQEGILPLPPDKTYKKSIK